MIGEATKLLPRSSYVRKSQHTTIQLMSQESWSLHWFLKRLALLIGIGATLYAFAYFSSFVDDRLGFNQLEIFSILVSGTLSAALIIVYLRQNKILDTHATILRAEHRPVISVTSREIGKSSPSSFSQTQSTDHIVLNLKNSGNEVAVDLRLFCFINYPGNSTGPVASNVVTLDQPESSSNSIESTGGVLPADNTEQTFYSLVKYNNIHFGKSIDAHEENLPFTIAISQIEDNRDLEDNFEDQPFEVEVGFVVLFSNTVGDQFGVGVNPAYRIDLNNIESTLTLEHLEEHSEKDFLNNVISDDTNAPLVDVENLRL